MSVVTATVFMNNKSQAIRIPKAAELPNTTKSVNIIIQGDMRIITPLNNVWDSWFNDSNSVSDDFMLSREQPQMQEREEL
ncbi:type II toxin-antitoxin system VapB family antitoxin [Gallibacterium anatis]|uniref:Antitoxin n=1 Tax=Gallibacterium anatis 12656/12 TaxID=1195244 RepID=U1H262_9PAST|nr:type II toxin-antitoxin system VapB family antitoxin [Gallibacterium anatis]ERF78868.1 antitoxin [Gallibacterium anatis 12656/12]KGQ24807.1 antitoxin [Gallibacterium anatis CCM5995]KGQ28368.1 antitoxin [Gallibacterium anatis]KGQ36258.1 antitoxin [Gallibacterium anatis]KGQ45315.1 antitoxin [Gallibacterium anatis]